MGENLLSIGNSTSRCSAQSLAHLGSKATNPRRDSFPNGHDQRSRCQIFWNVHCLPASTLLAVSKRLCYLLFSISVAIGQFSSNWPGWSSRTVKSRYKKMIMLHSYSDQREQSLHPSSASELISHLRILFFKSI